MQKKKDNIWLTILIGVVIVGLFIALPLMLLVFGAQTAFSTFFQIKLTGQRLTMFIVGSLVVGWLWNNFLALRLKKPGYLMVAVACVSTFPIMGLYTWGIFAWQKWFYDAQTVMVSALILGVLWSVLRCLLVLMQKYGEKR